MPKHRTLISVLCLAVAGIAGPSALAEDLDTHFKIYGGPAYVAPMSDEDITFGTVTDTLEAEAHVGWNLGIEGRFNKWFGIEVDYVNASQNVSFGGSTIGEVNFSPLTATFDIHVVHTKVIDLYLGPSYSYVNWGDIEVDADSSGVTGSSEFGTESAHGWGVSLGLDIGLGRNFAIQGGLKYLNVDLEPEGFTPVGVDPLVARLGVAFRF
jgi:outer membrane protein W